ncbi:MAG: hypothetical protein RL536_247 [Candidatus Parcubacteria bacterium]|jgi:micrococcal nuclease
MKYKKVVTIVIVLILLCVPGYYAIYSATVITIDGNKSYHVEYVLDGDTFKVKVGSHIVTVRMLGIDTPESVDPRKQVQCYGQEASLETKNLLMGKNVRLTLNPNREEKDKYGRYLAYVYLRSGANEETDLFVNEFLLKNGYAREYTYGKTYMYQEEFKKIENDAKEAGRGLWGACEQAINSGTKKINNH